MAVNHQQQALPEIGPMSLLGLLGGFRPGKCGTADPTPFPGRLKLVA